MKSRYIIFHCKIDKSWVVAAKKNGYYLGVAECPDQETAQIVKCAMDARDTDMEKFKRELPKQTT